MDIQMPHVSGLELIEQMKADEDLKTTPVMAVTAYAAKGDEERIRDAGAEGYVSKPISVMRFVDAVQNLLTAATQHLSDAQREEPEMQEAALPEGETASGNPAETVESDLPSEPDGNEPHDAKS
jgi:two-component system, cell cycle response regulator DivK